MMMPRYFAFLGEWLRHCSGNSMLAAIRTTNELTNSWRSWKLPSDIRSSGFLVFLIFPVFISLTLESNAVLRKGSIRAYSHGMSTGGQNLLEARIILWTFCPVAAVNDERSQRGESGGDFASWGRHPREPRDRTACLKMASFTAHGE